MDYNEEDHPLLIELLDRAGETQTPPAQKKLPKQKLPSWLGKLIKAITLPFIYLDCWMQWLAKKIVRPPFQRHGKCRKRGNCCYYILVRASSSLGGKLFYLWYTQVHGFYPRLRRPYVYGGKKVWVMGCRYLQKDGSCGQYRLRPAVCRQWPVIEYFGYPRILKGCGFSVTPRKPLDDLDFSGPKLEKSASCAKKEHPLKIVP